MIVQLCHFRFKKNYRSVGGSSLVLVGRCAGINSLLIGSEKGAAPADAQTTRVVERKG